MKGCLKLFVLAMFIVILYYTLPVLLMFVLAVAEVLMSK